MQIIFILNEICVTIIMLFHFIVKRQISNASQLYKSKNWQIITPSISFYPLFSDFNNNFFFYTLQKTLLKNTLSSRLKLTYEETCNFKSKNICNFTSRKSFSKLKIAVIQIVLHKTSKNPKIIRFLIFSKCTKKFWSIFMLISVKGNDLSSLK